MPVQIAYAVPMGNDLSEEASKIKLTAIADIVSAEGSNLLKPSVYLSPTAQQISNSPASIKVNQAITFLIYEANG